jgi:hypothetical protein
LQAAAKSSSRPTNASASANWGKLVVKHQLLKLATTTERFLGPSVADNSTRLSWCSQEEHRKSTTCSKVSSKSYSNFAPYFNQKSFYRNECSQPFPAPYTAIIMTVAVIPMWKSNPTTISRVIPVS